MQLLTPLEVIGGNLRSIRAEYELTMDAVARAVREYGQYWSTGRVSDIESGRGAASLEVLVVLAFALSDLTKKSVGPSDLLRTSAGVELGDGFALTGNAFIEVVQGDRGPNDLDVADVVGAEDEMRALVERGIEALGRYGHGLTVGQIRGARKEWRDADQRAARKLGLTDEEFMGLCLRVFGRLMSAEAEERAGEGATPQKRGRVTRGLLEELRAANDGND